MSLVLILLLLVAFSTADAPSWPDAQRRTKRHARHQAWDQTTAARDGRHPERSIVRTEPEAAAADGR